MARSNAVLAIHSHDILAPGEYIITKGPNTQYSVWHTGLEEPYEIKTTGNKWTCTCPAFIYRPGDCKHITMVKFEGAWNERI